MSYSDLPCPSTLNKNKQRRRIGRTIITYTRFLGPLFAYIYVSIQEKQGIYTVSSLYISLFFFPRKKKKARHLGKKRSNPFLSRQNERRRIEREVRETAQR